MSAKNSLKAKQARREERAAKKLSKQAQDNSQFHVIATPSGDAMRRDYGRCPTCMFQAHVNQKFIAVESDRRVNLEHNCWFQFPTQEELDNIEASAQYFVDTEIMKAAAEAELDDWAADPVLEEDAN